MDALSHCLESYCSPFFHPLGEGIALEGLRLCKEWLPVAVADGKNIEARAFMLAASSMGAVAFQKGLGGMHSMSHPAPASAARTTASPTLWSCRMCSSTMRRAIKERLAALARYLDLPGHTPESVIDWVLALRKRDRHPAHAEGDRRRRAT